MFFHLETGIYISSQARVRVTLRPFARHQKIKYNSPRNCAFPKMPYYHKYFPKTFSDAFAFGRVLLFANSRPKLDLSFQIILGKKINARPFPCRAYSTRTNQRTLRLSFCRLFAIFFWLDTYKNVYKFSEYKNKRHTQTCMSLFWKPASTYPPRPCPAKYFLHN